jgi:hypothetical protein
MNAAEQQIELGKQVESRGNPKSHEEAVALGAYLRSIPERRYVAMLPRKARPEDGQMVCAVDHLTDGPTFDLFARSVMGQIPNHEPAFPDVGAYAVGLQRQAANRYAVTNCNMMAGATGFVWSPPKLDANHVRTACYNVPICLGALLDWLDDHDHMLKQAE